jgi:hypothetical protein
LPVTLNKSFAVKSAPNGVNGSGKLLGGESTENRGEGKNVVSKN